MNAAVRMRGLVVSRNDRVVLGPLDLDVDPGEFFVVAGPNGSGKSTLLGTLAGLLRPGAGSLEVLGTPVHGARACAFARRVAYCAQSAEACPPFTVEAAVVFGRAPRQGLWGGVNDNDLTAVRRAMALTRVEHLAERPLTALSGGERRRVLLAQALAREPDLLLLDEPTAGLDPGHQMLVWDMLERLRRKRGVTVVVVSHDLYPASAYAQRMLLLLAGRAQALGPPETVLTADILDPVYGWPMAVDRDAATGAPRVAPMTGSSLAGRNAPDHGDAADPSPQEGRDAHRT